MLSNFIVGFLISTKGSKLFKTTVCVSPCCIGRIIDKYICCVLSSGVSYKSSLKKDFVKGFEK